MPLARRGAQVLAVDVSSAYSQRRTERSYADAAALAGAQDLDSSATRTISAGQRTLARTHALQSLMNQVGVTVPMTGACDPSSDISNCILAPFHVAIASPAHACVNVNCYFAVQVGIHNPSFQTSFARLFGQSTWDVGLASVAGLSFSAQYAVVTLQPPKPRNNGTDANLNKDLIVSGNNTLVNVTKGDIGTNTSATTTNAGEIRLADGYFIDHYDDLSAIGDTWSKPDGIHPIGEQITSLVNDPGYTYASFTGAPTYSNQAAGVTPCSGANFPTDYTTMLAGAVCYSPGIYTNTFSVATGGGPSVAYLMPGAYSFAAGIAMHGTLGAGLVSNQPGVVLVFPESNTHTLDANSAVNLLLNAGSQTCTTDGCRAAPVVDFSGASVQTPDGLTITIEVVRDNNCFSGLTPIISAACNVNQNTTVNLAGTGTMIVAGILYGPSDNMSINGNSSQGGLVGQLFSWSVTYTGGSTLTQEYPGNLRLGVLRLDAACTSPGGPC